MSRKNGILALLNLWKLCLQQGTFRKLYMSALHVSSKEVTFSNTILAQKLAPNSEH
jgi:hypothetical protein